MGSEILTNFNIILVLKDGFWPRSHLFLKGWLLNCLQKQPPEVFCKKRWLWKFRKIHRKTPAPGSLSLIKLQALPATLLKKETLAQVFSCEFCEISKNTFFTEHLWATASVLISIAENFPWLGLRFGLGLGLVLGLAGNFPGGKFS